MLGECKEVAGCRAAGQGSEPSTLHGSCMRLQAELWRMAGAQVDEVLGERKPALEDIQALRFTTRVLNESMRLYPQPPVLIRRALQDDVLAGYKVALLPGTEADVSP